MPTLDETANALAVVHARREGSQPWQHHHTAYAEAQILAARGVVLLDCAQPDCGLPAEVVDLYVQPSTSGPVWHLATSCPARHHLVETVP